MTRPPTKKPLGRPVTGAALVRVQLMLPQEIATIIASKGDSQAKREFVARLVRQAQLPGS